jgi:uncharacterized membrane protein YfcA
MTSRRHKHVWPGQLRWRSAALLYLIAVSGTLIVAFDADRLPPLFFTGLSGLLGLLAAAAWATSAYLASERPRASERRRPLIEALSNWVNFQAALLTAMATILQTLPPAIHR